MRGAMRAGWVAGDHGSGMSPSFRINEGLGDLLMNINTSGTPSRVPPWVPAKAVIYPLKPSASICRVISLSGNQGAQVSPNGDSPRVGGEFHRRGRRNTGVRVVPLRILLAHIRSSDVSRKLCGVNKMAARESLPVPAPRSAMTAYGSESADLNPTPTGTMRWVRSGPAGTPRAGCWRALDTARLAVPSVVSSLRALRRRPVPVASTGQ